MRIGLTALVAALALVACRDKTPRPDPGPQAPPQTTSDDGSVPVPIPTMLRVSLLDSGSEPRAALRYKLSVGDKQVVILRLRYTASNRLRAAAETQITYPGIKLVFHLEIIEALRGDRVRYRFDLAEGALTDVGGADKRIVATAGETIKLAQGIRGSAVVDSRGVIRDGTIDVPKQLDPSMQLMIDSMRSSMEQLAVPLPAEPIGVGAKWELSETLATGRTSVEQTTIYELLKSDDGEIEIVGTVEQDADRQDVDLAGFEYAELLSLTAKGEESSTIRLERLAPIRAKLSLVSESRFEFAKKSGRRQALITTGTAEVGVTSK